MTKKHANFDFGLDNFFRLGVMSLDFWKINLSGFFSIT